MKTMHKFRLVLIGAVLALAILACSCGSFAATPTVSPLPPTITSRVTVSPEPTATLEPIPTATLDPSPTATLEPTITTALVEGMAGRWLDPDTKGTVTTILESSRGYEVASVINPGRGGNEVTATDWSNGILTWTYCIPNGNCITSVTVSLHGDSLDTTWTDDRGSSGETTFRRLP